MQDISWEEFMKLPAGRIFRFSNIPRLKGYLLRKEENTDDPDLLPCSFIADPSDMDQLRMNLPHETRFEVFVQSDVDGMVKMMTDPTFDPTRELPKSPKYLAIKAMLEKQSGVVP